MKYVALLRGINVGSRNKVSMRELKACFEEQGFTEVSTYVNSGNVLFESDESDAGKIAGTCERAIEKRFGFSAPVMVMTTGDFISAIDQAPDWWAAGSADSRHDVIFVIPPADPGEIMAAIGALKDAEEKVARRGNVIFWSIPTRSYGRSRVVALFNSNAYERITLRSSTTAKKLRALIAEKE